MIEDQGKKQVKAIEDHRKQLVAPNELIKRILISKEIVYHTKIKKNIFELIKERSCEFYNLEKGINTNNLINK